MKRIITICATLFMVATVAMAQNDAAPAGGTWSTSTTPALKVSEQIFNNWSKAGNSTFDITSSFFGNYKYTHPKYVWDNVVDLAYGYAWQDLDPEGVLFETRRKSNDKIDITSALSWNAYKGWGASFTANLKTQFGRGYEYDGVGKAAEETKQLVSDFFAPAYLTTALSFEYKKSDWSVALSFLTGKTTFVCNDWFIINGYNYGVIQNDKDDPKKPFDPEKEETYKNIKNAYFALGSYIRAQYLKKDIVPNLDLYARIELFYDYHKPKNMGWKNIDANTKWYDDADGTGAKTKYTGVEAQSQDGFERLKGKNWIQRRAFETDLDMEVKLDYRFSSHIAANFALNLKYDTDFSGMGRGGHWQLYQLAGVSLFFNWKTPRS